MSARTWTCQRQTAGAKCKHENPKRKQLCEACGKRRAPSKAPAHMAALDIPYAVYVELNGGPDCGICGRAPKPGKRHHRDHDHKRGIPRGLLCFRCNAALRAYMTLGWLRAAVAYLERTA